MINMEIISLLVKQLNNKNTKYKNTKNKLYSLNIVYLL